MIRLVLLCGLLALNAAAQTPTEEEVSFAAVGDVMLSRSVARAITRHKSVDFPFRRMRKLLKEQDLVFGNLEGPITPGDEVPHRAMSFRADPGVELALRDAGFTILSLANNHTPDQGEQGLRDTFAALRSVGLAFVGAGENENEAAQAVFIERKGIRFAFLAYSDVLPSGYRARRNRCGTNRAHIESMVKAVQLARTQADIVIVSMHAGREYHRANEDQQAFARAAIDAGADLVIGHHPHVLQAVERYKDHFIAYSLGNFVFDQTQNHAVKEGAVLQARFTKHGLTSLRFVPYELRRLGQPRRTKDPDVVRRIRARLEYPMAEDGTIDLTALP